MPSVTCLRLSDIRVICRVTYFYFPIQSAIFPYRSPGSTAAYVVYGHRTLPTTWEVRFLYAAYSPGNDFDLILTVKMETTHPVDGYFFCSELRAIYNHWAMAT